MDQVDARIRFQDVAPGALARVRFARYQQNAQPVADAVDRDDLAVVLHGQFVAAGAHFQLEKGLAAVVEQDFHGHADVRLDRDLPPWPGIALDPDHGVPARPGRIVVEPDRHGQRFAEQAVGRRRFDDQSPVALVLPAGQKEMDWPAAGPAVGIAAGVGRVVDLSVGNRDDAGQALARHFGERALERPEQQGAVVPAVEPDPDGPDLQIVQPAQLLPDRRQGLCVQLAARFEALAGRFVHDDHRDIRQRFAHFVDQRRIRQNRPDQGRRQGPVQNAPRSPVKPEQKQGGGDAGKRRQQPPGH